MTRQSVLQHALLAVGVALGLPKAAKALESLPSTPTRSVTIAQLLSASFSAARSALLAHDGWSSRDIAIAAREGRVELRDFGPVVVFVPEGIREPEQLSSWILWTDRDDANTRSMTDKVSFVSARLEKAFSTLDELFLKRLGSGRAVVSKTYRYELGSAQEVGNIVTGHKSRITRYAVQVFTGAAFSAPDETVYPSLLLQ